jgi:hypothetical protein
VGIGATSITANTNYNTLQIQGQSGSGGAILRLMTTDGSTSKAMIFADTGGLTIRQETNHPMAFSTNNTERMRIDTSGRLLVGTTSTNQNVSKLVINASSPSGVFDNHLYLQGNETNGAISTGGVLGFGGHDGASSARNWCNIVGLKENSTTGNTAAFLGFQTRPAGGNPTERMRIDSSGNVGIGTTSPATPLHIKPASNMSQLLLEQNNATDGYALFQDGPNGGHLKFMRRISGSDTQTLLLRSDGGLCFGTDSAAANALDDYEEGSLNWELAKSGTPSLGSNNGSSVKYVKVGRLVHISGRVRTDSTGSASNDTFVFQSGSTLPFTPETSGTSVVGHWRSQDQTDNSLTASIAWVGGSTTLYLYTIDAKNDYTADTNNVPVDNQTNLVITFSLTYRANS